MKPTRTRYWVIVFAVTLAILSYIDRVAISKAAPFISQDLHLTKTQMGEVFSAFAIAYALAEIPGGWLGDYLGPRSVLMRIVIWWSFFTASAGWMWNGTALRINQFFFGAGEAGGFPNLTKAFTTWLQPHERVRAQGIMWMAARWGGAFTPLLTAIILQYVHWRIAFMMFACLGIIWAIFFFRWFRDNPKDHPKVNEAEWKLLEANQSMQSAQKGPFPWKRMFVIFSPLLFGLSLQFVSWQIALTLLAAVVLVWVVFFRKRKQPGQPPEVAGAHDVPWGKLIKSRPVVLLWLQYFLVTYPWYFYITWLSTYLREHRGIKDDITSGVYAIVPLFFGGIGCIFSGFILPRVARMTGDMNRARKMMATTGFLGGCAFLLICIQMKDPFYGILAMGMASFCNDLAMPCAWGACMDIGGKYAGTVSGSMNMMGNLAGFVAPQVGGIILDRTGGNWDMFLYTMALSYFIGAFTWPFLNSNKTLEESA
jgi:MFS transporter, ACS family, glucarate transporter